MINFKKVLNARPKDTPIEELIGLSTVWGEEVLRASLDEQTGEAFVPRAEHPTPQFHRDEFMCLNGWWTCDVQMLFYDPKKDTARTLKGLKIPEIIDTPILVPFSPESNIGGAKHTLTSEEVLWYRRDFDLPSVQPKKRYLLHFQAVDDTCAVWVNGRLQGTHSGGYLPFVFDITHDIKEGANRIELAVTDPSDAGVQLRGKQRLEHSGIWYSAQSGIWQNVWLEVVPAAYLFDAKATIEFDGDLRRAQLIVDLTVFGKGTAYVDLLNSAFDEQSCSGEVLAQGRARTKVAPSKFQTLSVSMTVENPHLWSPDDPYLYAVRYRFGDDVVYGYLAFRKVEVKEAGSCTRFFLNNEPMFLKGVLDQGYWPESHMTPPTDAALVFDIEQMQALGFNMLRKHIKIEDERWYYHCDRLGMMVLQDMVTGGGDYEMVLTQFMPALFKKSWGSFNDTTHFLKSKLGATSKRYQEIWKQTSKRTFSLLHNHPCIVTWVLFNEGWGQFNSAEITRKARTWDASRPIESVSGWFDQGVGDYYGVHNYFRKLEVFPDKKGCRENLDPEGAAKHAKRAFVTCEFGGVVFNVAGHTQHERSFGYDVRFSQKEFACAVGALVKRMNSLEKKGLSGYVYTQVSDIEEETNGLLTYDRKINKMFPLGSQKDALGQAAVESCEAALGQAAAVRDEAAAAKSCEAAAAERQVAAVRGEAACVCEATCRCEAESCEAAPEQEVVSAQTPAQVG